MLNCLFYPLIVVNEWAIIPEDVIHKLSIIDQYFLQRQSGGIRGTVVARWTTGQQVERSILRQEHGSYTRSMVHNKVISFAQVVSAQYSFNSAELWPKTPIIYSFSSPVGISLAWQNSVLVVNYWALWHHRIKAKPPTQICIKDINLRDIEVLR